jgi:RimJ/RimL family protein N-acetyltransferase
MAEYSFHPLAEIDGATWLTLLNDPEVHRHMPLGGTAWTASAAADWARGKDAQWTTNGYGPWALRVDGVFAGWGGFQKEGADADLGLVLLPQFWGHGARLHAAMLAKGFDELGLDSITILLPPSRVRMKGLVRLGYLPDGEIVYDGHRFLKFRMLAR